MVLNGDVNQRKDVAGRLMKKKKKMKTIIEYLNGNGRKERKMKEILHARLTDEWKQFANVRSLIKLMLANCRINRALYGQIASCPTNPSRDLLDFVRELSLRRMQENKKGQIRLRYRKNRNQTSTI